jgi:hypothetical protein
MARPTPSSLPATATGTATSSLTTAAGTALTATFRPVFLAENAVPIAIHALKAFLQLLLEEGMEFLVGDLFIVVRIDFLQWRPSAMPLPPPPSMPPMKTIVVFSFCAHRAHTPKRNRHE